MRWLLRLYPWRWRERYEAEAEALLDATPATASAVIDVLLGALDAHLRPQSSFDPDGAREGAPWTLAVLGLAVLAVVYWLTAPPPDPFAAPPDPPAAVEAR